MATIFNAILLLKQCNVSMFVLSDDYKCITVSVMKILFMFMSTELVSNFVLDLEN